MATDHARSSPPSAPATAQERYAHRGRRGAIRPDTQGVTAHLKGGGELFTQPSRPDPGGRLDDVVGDRFLVLGRDQPAFGESRGWWRDDLEAVVTTVDELGDPSGELASCLDQRSVQTVVVRPDRYVVAAVNDLDRLTRQPVVCRGRSSAGYASQERWATTPTLRWRDRYTW